MAGMGDDYQFQAPTDGPPPPEGTGPGGSNNLTRIALIGVAVVILAGAAYWFFGRRTPPPAPAGQATTAPPPAPKTTADDFEHIDLPPLDDNDALGRQRIGILPSNRPVAARLAAKRLVPHLGAGGGHLSH